MIFLGKEAGLAFERAAAIQTKNLNEPDDAANSLTEAYKSYRKSDPEDAARVLQQAINHYTGKGNFRRAATQQQNLAELYEVEIGDEKRAAEAYETAAGWFESDHAEACVIASSKLQTGVSWKALENFCLRKYLGLQAGEQIIPEGGRSCRHRGRLLQID